MIVGNADIWSDTFPEDLVPRVLDLITDTWANFAHPGPNDLEVPTTRRFKHALKQAKDFNRLPLRLEREPAEDDPKTGTELGRIDLKFLPAISAREEVYLAFECKRLNVIQSGTRRSLAPEYVTDGMMRFVTGQYAGTMRHSGMIGYVLDGRRDDAIRFVERHIGTRTAQLCMAPPAKLALSTLCPQTAHVRQTSHQSTSSHCVIIHHVFLATSIQTSGTSAFFSDAVDQ